jgi:hypothetical protein
MNERHSVGWQDWELCKTGSHENAGCKERKYEAWVGKIAKRMRREVRYLFLTREGGKIGGEVCMSK